MQNGIFFVDGKEHKVMELHKAFYGRIQALWTSNIKLDAIVVSLNFTKCIIKHDLYIVIKERGSHCHYVCRCLLITRSRMSDIHNFKCEMVVLSYERS